MHKNHTILSVGSMAFDSIRTPAGKADQVLGGSVNYFSLAASLFTPIKIVAVVGDDFPTGHLEFLSKKNIDVSGVQIVKGKTFHWVGEYNTSMNEAFLLSDESSLEKAAKKIQAMGPSTVIIKRGEYGSAVFTPTGIFLAPAFLVDDVIDPTGAGDSFAGALVGYLAQNGVNRSMVKKDPATWEQLIRRAVIYGTVMASFTIQEFSVGRLKTLTKEELMMRKEKFIKMISFGM